MMKHRLGLLLGRAGDTGDVEDRYVFGECCARALVKRTLDLWAIDAHLPQYRSLRSAHRHRICMVHEYARHHKHHIDLRRGENAKLALVHTGITISGIRSVKFVAEGK